MAHPSTAGGRNSGELAFAKDATHELYQYNGAWRFADYGVKTYYEANAHGAFENELPPAGAAAWTATGGAGVGPSLTFDPPLPGAAAVVAAAAHKLTCCVGLYIHYLFLIHVYRAAM